jgi:hypothetical protein
MCLSVSVGSERVAQRAAFEQNWIIDGWCAIGQLPRSQQSLG